MPQLANDTRGRLAARIERRVLESKILFFPIYLRNHWIAGILMADEDNVDGYRTIGIEIYDSAPSAAIHCELQHRLHMAWPGLSVRIRRSIRQIRNSEDCGIYMSAVFFSFHLDIQIKGKQDLPSRLRPLLHRGGTCEPKIPRDMFLQLMAEELSRKPTRAPKHELPSADSSEKTQDKINGGGRSVPTSAEKLLEGGQPAQHKKKNTNQAKKAQVSQEVDPQHPGAALMQRRHSLQQQTEPRHREGAGLQHGNHRHATMVGVKINRLTITSFPTPSQKIKWAKQRNGK